MKERNNGKKSNTIKVTKNKQITFICFLCLFFVSSITLSSQEKYPGEDWEKAGKPEDLGYSSERLAKAKEFAEGLNTAAVVIVVDGVILDQWGEIATKYIVHSIRKSFLSALFGNYVRNGTIDLDATMKDLGIDDKEPSLTDLELLR